MRAKPLARYLHSRKPVFQAKQKFRIEHIPPSQPRTMIFKYKYKIVTHRNSSWISDYDSFPPSGYTHYHQQAFPAMVSFQLPLYLQGPGQSGDGASVCRCF